ncbi:hypothetical protein P4284_08365 [Bacillus swezeyi]|nr:hypothetical protein [Bacillus swezeyi]
MMVITKRMKQLINHLIQVEFPVRLLIFSDGKRLLSLKLDGYRPLV